MSTRSALVAGCDIPFRSTGYPRGIPLVDTAMGRLDNARLMDIRVLGPVEIGGVRNLEPRDRAALGVFAIRRDHAVSADQLADALWGDAQPASWPKQVQICVSRLRKALGPDAIESSPGGYRLRIEDPDLDVARFEQQITRSREFAASGEPDRAAAGLGRALALWRGDPYTDLDGWEPARTEVDRLQELRRSAEEEWMEARLAAGDHRAVALEAGALVVQEPLRERRWQTLALAQYRCGRQADALRTLVMARATLRDELDIDPGPELTALEDAIVRQDASLVAEREATVFSDACPYKGLASYDVEDVDLFFGREDDVSDCLERLRTNPVLVLSGPSGSGKSSLARAGLAVALAARGRATAVFLPGTEPLAAMTAAAASAGPAPVLIVDQFEEVFSLGLSAPVVLGFLDRLAVYAVETAPVVIVIRSDFLGGLSTSSDLSRVAERGLRLVAPLSGPSLRAAIERPAAQAGLRLEHGLVDLLERDTEGEPGSLPLLSHALAETWRRRDANVLSVEGYLASGGIRGAVAHSADRLYDSLAADQRGVLRSLLLRMVTPSSDGPPVRCRVPARSVRGDPDRDRVVALLVGARLITAEEDSYELAHEALARAWPRLQTWLEDDAEGQRILRHLVTQADDWDALGRPDSELYRGTRLDLAREWCDRADPALSFVERDFLDASVALSVSETTELGQRARVQARQNRILRGLLAATASLAVVAVLGGVLALRGREDALLEGLANRSQTLRTTDRGAAALLAVEAFRRRPDATAWSSLLSTFTASPGFLGYRYVPDATSLLGARVPGIDRAVIARDHRTLQVIDLVSGAVTTPFAQSDADTLWSTRLRVSADGLRVARRAGSFNPSDCEDVGALPASDGPGCSVLEVYDIVTGRRVLGPVSAPTDPGDLAINADGSLVAVTGGLDGELLIYRTADGGRVGTVDGLGRPTKPADVLGLAGVAFGPDGRIYLGSPAGPIRVIDPTNASIVQTWEAPPFTSNNYLTVTLDGRLIGAGTQGLVALDVADGASIWTTDLREGLHPEPCPWFAVNAPRDVLYCGTFYGVIEERSLLSGARTGVTFDPQQGSVGQLDLTTDGDELTVFGDGSPTVAIWRLDGSGLATRIVAADHVVYDGYDVAGDSILVAKRGETSATWDEFTDFSVWDPSGDSERVKVPARLEGAGWAGPATLTAHSLETDTIVFLDAATGGDLDALTVPLEAANLFVTAGGELEHVTIPEDAVWTVDPATRQRIDPTIPVTGTPVSVSATRHGDRVVVTSWQDAAAATTVHDGRDGAQIGEPLVGPGITAVSLDGVLVGATGGRLAEYDLGTMQPVGNFPGARGEINALQFSSDGRVLLASSNDQTVSIYDVATRRRIGDPISTFSPFITAGYLRQDGRAVAVNQQSGVAVWDIAPEHLVAAACRLAGRNLTEGEWQSYLADVGPYRDTCPEEE